MQRLLLTALVASSLFLFAGSFTWTTLPLVLLAALAAVARVRHTFSFPDADRIVDLCLIAALVCIGVQLIPLPPVVRDTMSPHAAEVTAAVQLNAHPDASTWSALSVDPSSTWHALATLSLAVLTFWTARGLFASGGVRRIARTIVLIGAVLATVALIFRAIEPHRYYGHWLPANPSATPWGPFVNRNHFAAWLLLAVSIAAGYLIAHVRIRLPDRDVTLGGVVRSVAGTWAVPIALSGMVMSAALLLTLSRSAWIAAAVTAMVGWQLGRPRLGDMSPRRALAVAASVVGALVLILVLVDVPAMISRFASTFVDRPVDRVVIWRETLRLIADFWVTGVGAGAFGTAMLVYQQPQIRMSHLGEWVHFNQAHSHYLQVPAEGGLILAAIALVGLVALLHSARRALAADRGEIWWIRMGAGAGLAGLAAQSVWETALTLPANAVLCGVTTALLLHRRDRQDDYVSSDPKRSRGLADAARHGPARPATMRQM
jgi:O-antigen ligase